ncbi:MAG: sensor histidine kinase [Candidatus Levyibacteriota bacterium]
MFHSARLTLTSWYLLIIMAISISFSAFIFFGASNEFDRVLRIQRYRLEHPSLQVQIVQHNSFGSDDLSLLHAPDPDVIGEAKLHVFEALFGVNVIILLFSAFAGYFLAGKTLRPIQEMVDEQNRFITDASHELRTPLTSLRSEIEVNLRNREMDMTMAKKLLESNLEEVVALQALSDNLLELAQDGDGVTEKNMTDVSIVTVIQQAIKRIEPLAKKKQITIKYDDKDARVRGFADRLTEVFVILLDNAIKYSPKKHTVTIKNVLEKDTVTISVSDTGSGIQKEDVPHIFDRFYRANKSRSKTDVAGYGLGLSIAKKIVSAHKGKISVTSILEKKTTFSVALPKREQSV